MSQPKILVVEDEYITAQSVCNVLRAQGYEVCGPVDSGEQAIQLAHQTSPDLILMDIRLKGDVDGIQAAREIYRQRQVPILLLTAYPDPDTLLYAQNSGSVGYILKPFDEHELVFTVAAALNRSRTTDEIRQREQFLALLNEITHAALQTSDLPTMLQTLVDRMGEVIHADACYITLWDEQTQSIIPAAASGEWRDRYSTFQLLSDEYPAMSESVLQAGHTLVVEDTLNTPYVSRRISELFSVRSAIGLPLIANDKKLGVTMLTFRSPHHFTDDEIARCEQLAGHIALAISQARSLEAERTARRRAEAVYYVANALTSLETLDRQLQLLTNRIAEALPAHNVLLVTFDLERQEIEHFVYGGFSAGIEPDMSFEELMEGLTGWVIRHQTPVLSTKAMIPDPRESHRVQQRRARHRCGSIIVVPLVYRERILGTLTAANLIDQRDLTTDDLELMRAMADQAVIAIENTRLGQALTRRLHEAETFAQVTASLTRSLDLDRVLQSIAQAALRVIPRAHSCVIHLLDADGQRLIPRTVAPEIYGLNTRLDMRVGQGIAGLVIAQRRVINVPDALRDARFIPTYTFPPERALLTAPLIVDDEIIGTLSLNSDHVGAFDENDERLLTTLADQAAITVRNARLHDQLQQRVQELSFLNIIGRSLISSLDPEEVFERVLEGAIDILDAEAASILLLDNTGQELVFIVSAGAGKPVKNMRMPVAEGIAGYVVREGRPVIVPNAAQDPHFYPTVDQITGFRTRSILAVPLEVKNQIIGVIEALNKQEGFFNQDDQKLLSSIAQWAAVAIENAKLYQSLRNRMDELERTQDQLIQSARLAAVGKLAEGAAHELNNPLAIIVGYTQLLMEELPAASPLRQDLARIDEAAVRAQSIVRALLNFASQSEPPNREPLDITQVIQTAVELIRSLAKTNQVQIEQINEPGLPLVPGDNEQLRQACLNILINAIQAMPNGGTLRIIVQHQEPYVVIQIQDTGIGIPAENLSRIFDPFFTTREVGKGMGLGLAVAYGVINRHGGKILVDSTVGQGSTFTILLPVTDLKNSGSAKLPEKGIETWTGF